MERKRVAVFDVDGTIFRSSLLIQIVNKLLEQGVFPRETEVLYARQREEWLDREGDYDAYITAMVDAFAGHIRGVEYSILQKIAKDVVEGQWKHTYRYTRDLIQELKAQNYFLLTVSHSPKTALDEFCRRFGFDKVYGMLYETDADGKFTGAIIDRPLLVNKAMIVRRAVEKEGLTLEGSIGVGDSESDISFLELMSTPICFNPNQKLYQKAKQEGWKVVVERKDVIYEL